MKTSDVLIKAKTLLARGHEQEGRTQFLCFAIFYADQGKKSVKVIERIEKSIGSKSDVVRWLLHNKHTTKEQLTFKAAQEYRHRWLDALIAEYQEAGD